MFGLKFGSSSPAKAPEGGNISLQGVKLGRGRSAPSEPNFEDTGSQEQEAARLVPSIHPRTVQHLANEPASTTTAIVRIKTIEDLAQLPLPFDSIIKSIRIGPHLISKMCPVLFGGAEGSNAAKATILCIEQYLGSSELQSLQDSLNSQKNKKNWEVWPRHEIIVLPEQILVPIVRGHTNRESLSNRRQVHTNRVTSGLFDTFQQIVDWAIAENAADIHFNVHSNKQMSQVHFTIHGIYVAPKQWEIPTSTMLEMLGTAWMVSTGGNGPSYDPNIEQQCRIELHRPKGSIMLRWASIGSQYPGPSVTTRLIKLNVTDEIKSLESLSYLPDQIETLVRAQNSEKGAILFVGVVGSGKTHSLATLASMEPSTRKGMGVEDPVELIIPNMIQKSITRPLEDDGAANPFGPFLKTIKRSGMHYVLLGEIRDEVTGEALTDLVYTGTSVYTTTHASSAIGAYDKLAGDTIKVSRDFLSAPGNIKLIVYQALLPQNCPSCAKPVSELATDGRYKRYGQSYIDLIQGLYQIDMSKVRIRNEEGCPKCRHSTIAELNGYSGRTMVAEMFEPSEASLEMVKRADSIGLHRYFSSLRGDIPFDDPRMTGKTAMQCAIYKMSQGLIDPREIEPRFHSFETERRQRTANAQPKRITRSPEIMDVSLPAHAQGTVAEVMQ